MRRIVEFPLEDGDTFLVEIDEPEQGGLVKAAVGTGTVAKAQLTLEKSLEKVRPAAQFIIQRLRTLQDAPDEIEVTFGLKLSTEAGAVLASAGAEANYTVTLKWVREKKKRAGERKK